MNIAAFFDLDCTLVACNTGRLFLRDLRRRGEISLAKALRALSWLAKYRLAIVDLPTITAHVADFLRGKAEDDFAEQCQRLVEDEVLPRLLPAGLRAVERHREDGHVLALLSSSPRYIVEPVARALSVEAVGATEFEVERGRLTGQLRGPGLLRLGQGPLGREPGPPPRHRRRRELVLHRLVHRPADARAGDPPGGGEPRYRG